MEQWTEPTSQSNATPEPGKPDAFHTTSLPAAESTQSTEKQERREKLQLLWGDLLQAAVRDPGLLLDAYSRFHGYSLGNRLAALWQCQTRGLEPGPIHTYQGWKQLGYQVKSGEKALWLCMPLTRQISGDGKAEKPYRNGKSHKGHPRANENHRTNGHAAPNGSANGSEPKVNEDEPKTRVISAFVWKPHWFVLSQTEPIPGQEVGPLETPALGVWHKATALQSLGITEIPFDLLDGNCQGYAREQSLAVSSLAALPYKTLFHEMAHIVLGHTQGGECIDGAELPAPQPRYLREAEAEATALLLLATLDLPGQEYCRGYIQSWLSGEGLGEAGIGEASARRIFGAADKILRGGLSGGETGEDEFRNGSPVPAPPLPKAPLVAQSAEEPTRTAEIEFSSNALNQNSLVENAAAMSLQFEQLPARNGNGVSHSNGPVPNYGTPLPYTPVPFAGVIQKTDLPMEWRAATLPRPPTVSRVASPTANPMNGSDAFSLNGEVDLFQLLMSLHDAGSDLNPINGPHPDVKRALLYLQSKAPEEASTLLYWLHRAASALESAAQVANRALYWPLVEELYNPQGLGAPALEEADGELIRALDEGFADTPRAWLMPSPVPSPADNEGPADDEGATASEGSLPSEPPEPIPEESRLGQSIPEQSRLEEELNGTIALTGQPSSARAQASARRTLGRSLRSELQCEQRRFFAIAGKHHLPTDKGSAKSIREALSQLLEIPVKSRADLTARQWALAGSAIETGDLSW